MILLLLSVGFIDVSDLELRAIIFGGKSKSNGFQYLTYFIDPWRLKGISTLRYFFRLPTFNVFWCADMTIPPAHLLIG